MPKGCAHIASTESTECPEPSNQGGIQSERSGVNIDLHKINQCHSI